MATIRKRDGRWQVQVKKDGVRKSATFDTKGRASAWAAQIEQEIEAGARGDHSDKTLHDMITRYAEEVTPLKRGARWELIRLSAWKKLPFAYYKLSDITTPRLAEWRDERLKTVLPATVNREFNLMASMFEYARKEWQWLKVNPVRDVRRPPMPRHREKIFSDDERDAIMLTLNYAPGIEIESKQHIIALAFLFSLETAMRREEITELEWGDVDIEKRMVAIEITKNGDKRDVPLSRRAVELLGLVKDQPRPFDVHKDVLSTMFRRACKAAGVENAHFHDARATALTRLSKRLNVLELARMAGHRDTRSLMVYYRETATALASKLDD